MKLVKFLMMLCLATFLFVACSKNDDESVNSESSVLESFALVSLSDETNNVSTQPSLQWEQVISSDGDEVSYNVYIGESTDAFSLLEEGVAAINYDVIEELENATTYYWYVEAVDSNGVFASSSIDSFTTELASFMLTSFFDNDEDVSLKPSLQWEEVVDSDGNEVSYNVYIGESADAFSLLEEGLAAINYDVIEELENGTTYYWYIEAVASDKIFANSNIGSFTTEKLDVLIIFDDSATNENTLSLKEALIEAGFDAVISGVNHIDWDNTNPSLDNFEAVIHMNGTTWGSDMSEDAQKAMVNFVENEGGYYIAAEWNSWVYNVSNKLQFMEDLILISRGPYTDLLGYEIVIDQASHPVLEGVSNFSLDSDGMRSSAVVFETYPSVVLMTEDTNDAVIVREFNKGKILNFSHTGNYSNQNSFSDENIQNIIINFINWD